MWTFALFCVNNKQNTAWYNVHECGMSHSRTELSTHASVKKPMNATFRIYFRWRHKDPTKSS